MSGWFLMHRGWMASPDFQPEPFTEREAFAWSIEQAAHTAHTQWFNGQQFQVERGEFVTSNRKMAAAFKWGEKRVRGFIERMERRGKWTRRPTHRGAHVANVLTVCNYERFQAPAKLAGSPEGAAEDAARTQLGRSDDAQQKEGLNKGNEFQTMDGEERGLTPRAPALPYSEAWDAWKQIGKLKGWIKQDPKLTPARKSGLSKILKDYGMEGWIAALQRAANSPLLGGPDPPPWFTTDFVTTPTKFLKLYEGNYDKQFSSSGSGQQRSPWLDAREQLSAGQL
ncbi:MAG: hypothetical protein M3Q19_14505 [Pseudomonadota bacterium]|nr:hypothetical protein [Pseudomonadota bacterium]